MKTKFLFETKDEGIFDEIVIDFPFKLISGDQIDFENFPIEAKKTIKRDFLDYYLIEIVRYEYGIDGFYQVCFMLIA